MYKMCKNATLFISFLLLTSCTFNVSMAHTSGIADDVIDDTASNTPNVSPKITIPLSSTGL
jgi:hypothetical protein